MTAIPPNTVTEADLNAWYAAAEALSKAKAAEMLLRMRIFNAYFPNPTEGTNTVELPSVNGVPYALKATYPIVRKIDEAMLEVMLPKLRKKGIDVDRLVKRTPELILSGYRSLTAEEMELFDRVLESKPGSPALKITEIKKRT